MLFFEDVDTNSDVRRTSPGSSYRTEKRDDC